MNTLRTVIPCISRKINNILAITQSQTCPLLNQSSSRSVASLTAGNPLTQTHRVNSCMLLSKINTEFVQPVRFYQVKRVLKRRCKGCYFEERFGRLYVECTLKPRHKQMKMVNKKYLYKDDYSEGRVHEAAHWNYQNDRFYRIGKNKFSRYNWLEGRLGTEI